MRVPGPRLAHLVSVPHLSHTAPTCSGWWVIRLGHSLNKHREASQAPRPR
jgi:hypothetical protein